MTTLMLHGQVDKPNDQGQDMIGCSLTFEDNTPGREVMFRFTKSIIKLGALVGERKFIWLKVDLRKVPPQELKANGSGGQG